MDDIKNLVDSIVKHKNFKRLAAYSIQSLCKKCSPISNGWQEATRSAFDAGAPQAIAAVIAKNATDAELFLLGLTLLQACAAIGLGGSLLAPDIVPAVMGAYKEYAASAPMPSAAEAVAAGMIVNGVYSPAGKHAEPVAVTESFLRMLLFICTQSRAEAAQPAPGIVPLLLALLPKLPTPNAVRMCVASLESLVRADAGLTQLCRQEALKTIIAACSTPFGTGVDTFGAASAGRATATASAAAGSTARPTSIMSPTAAGSHASAGSQLRGGASGNAAAARLNQHVEPAFRLLDRVSRSEAGLRALRECQAVAQLAPTVEFAQAALDPTTSNLGVRLLARVMGNDVGGLMDKVRAAGTAAVSLSEAEFVASLLASLALDADVASRIVSGGHCTAIVALFTCAGGKAVSSKLAASFCQVVRRVASQTTEGLDAFRAADALPTILRAVRAYPDDRQLLTDGLSAAAELMTDEEALAQVQAAGDAASGVRPRVQEIVAILSTHGLKDAAVACSCAQFLFAALACGAPAEELVDAGVIGALIAAMASTPARAAEHLDLQVFGSLVLRGCTTRQADIDAIVEAGGIALAIANLQSRHAVGTAAAAAPSTDDAVAASASAGVQFRATGAMLVCISLTLLAAVCLTPGHTAHATSRGLIRAMLTAYSAHSDNDLVFEAFSALVDAVITESEVQATVAAVARSVTALKMISGDPVLFSIVETELGNEGAVAEADVDPSLTAMSPRERSMAMKKKLSEQSAGQRAAALAEDLCLLEAVAHSMRLSAVMVRAHGAAVLTRTIGIVAMIKGVPRAAEAAATGRGGVQARVAAATAAGKAASADAGGLPEAVQEEVLVRASSALTALSRLCLTHALFVPGLDPIPTSALPASATNAAGGRAAGSLASAMRARIGGGGGGSGGASAASLAAAAAARDRLLSRSGLTLTTSAHRRRSSGKTAGDELHVIQAHIAAAVHKHTVIKTLIRAINGRSTLAAHVAAASTALGVLALGSGSGNGSTNATLELIIAHSGVEAVTNALRNHAALSSVIMATANSLGCMVIADRGIDTATGLLRMPAPPETVGSAAVCARGATRQIIRELQTAAAASSTNVPGARWAGAAGQAALCSLLRVILCVADTAHGVELLRKQGAVDALIATLDASPPPVTAGAEPLPAAAGSAGASSGASSAAPRAGAGATSDASDAGGEGSGKSAVASALAGDAFASFGIAGDAGGGAAAGMESDASGHSAETSALIIASLSKLMDAKDLGDAVKIVRGSAEKCAAFTLKVAGVTLTAVALTTIYALSATQAGAAAGSDVWTAALEAVTMLATALAQAADALRALPPTSGAGGLDADRARAHSTSAACTSLLPTALRCATAVLHNRAVLRDATHGEEWDAAARALMVAGVRVAYTGSGCSSVSLRPTSPSAASVAERLQAAYAAATYDALLLVSESCALGHVARTVLCTESSEEGDGRPLDRLAAILSHSLDNLTHDVTSLCVSTLLALSQVPLDAGAPTATLDALGASAGAVRALRSASPCVERMLAAAVPDMLSTAASAPTGGDALTLLARCAAVDGTLAAQLRGSGLHAVAMQALGRYCDSGALMDDGVVEAHEVESFAEVATHILRGAASAFAACAGHVPAGESASTVSAGDAAAVARVMRLVGDDVSGELIACAPAMIAVCDLITTVCTPTHVDASDKAPAAPLVANGGVVSEPAAEAARAAVLDVDGRNLIVFLMSSAQGEPDLLRAASRALSALGGSSSGAASEVRKLLSSLRVVTALPALPDFVPATTSPVAAAAAAAAGSSSSGAVTPTAHAHSRSRTRGAGEVAGDQPIGSVLQQLDAAARDLAATLAAEKALTATAYRFVFDTLAAAVRTSVEVTTLAEAGHLAKQLTASTATDVTAAATGTPAHVSRRSGGGGSGILSPSFAGLASPTEGVRMRSASRTLRSPSGLLSPVGGASGSSGVGVRRSGSGHHVSVASGGLGSVRSPTTVAAHQSAFSTVASNLEVAVEEALGIQPLPVEAVTDLCAAIGVSGLQGIARLATVILIQNKRAGKHAPASALVHSTASAGAPAGTPALVMAYEQASDERVRLGDAAGSDSAAAVAAMYASASLESRVADVQPPLAAADVLRVFVDALRLGESSQPLGASMLPTRTLSASMCEAAALALAAWTEAATRGLLLKVVAAPVALPASPSEAEATESPTHAAAASAPALITDYDLLQPDETAAAGHMQSMVLAAVTSGFLHAAAGVLHVSAGEPLDATSLDVSKPAAAAVTAAVRHVLGLVRDDGIVASLASDSVPSAVRVAFQLCVAAEAVSLPPRAALAGFKLASDDAEDPFILARTSKADVMCASSSALHVAARALVASAPAEGAEGSGIAWRLVDSFAASSNRAPFAPAALSSEPLSITTPAALRIAHALTCALVTHLNKRSVAAGGVLLPRAALVPDAVYSPALASAPAALLSLWQTALAGADVPDVAAVAAAEKQAAAAPQLSAAPGVDAATNAARAMPTPQSTRSSGRVAPIAPVAEEGDEVDEEADETAGTPIGQPLPTVVHRPDATFSSTPGSVAASPAASGTPAAAAPLVATSAAEAEAHAEAVGRAFARVQLCRALADASARALSYCDVTSVLDADAVSVWQRDDVLASLRNALRLRDADAFATCAVQQLRRLCGLTHDAHSAAGTPTPAAVALRKAVGDAGLYSRVVLAMAVHASSAMYAREAVRFIYDAACASGGGVDGKSLGALGLNELCFKVLQTAMRKHGGSDEFMAERGNALLEGLSQLYASLSSQGFLSLLQRIMDATEAVPYTRRVVEPATAAGNDARFVYVRRGGGEAAGSEAAGSETSEEPEEVRAFLHEMEEFLVVAEEVEADAVPQVPPQLVARARAALEAHAADPRVCGILFRSLSRMADHAGNVPAIATPEFIDTLTAMMMRHLKDVFLVESALSVLRPLSVHELAVALFNKKHLQQLLCNVAVEHMNTLQPCEEGDSVAAGGGGAGGASGGKNAASGADAGPSADVLAALASPQGVVADASVPGKLSFEQQVAKGAAATMGEGEARDAALSSSAASGAAVALEPRIAHYCVQLLANISCDQTVEDKSSIPNFDKWAFAIGEGCPGGVARVVSSGGIDVLRSAMAAHSDRPRVLEDALCAMSNIAYATDEVRLHIGRTSAAAIVEALRLFNTDAHLFSMALRAVGNLTRCDENIVSVVGCGVIEAIVDGMRHNAGNQEVLRLAADVIGNLASIDESAVDKQEGLKALRGGQRRRESRKSMSSPAAASRPTLKSAGAASASSRMISSGNLQEAVISWLIDDGAHVGLTNAMTMYASDAELVSSCLRSLQYITETAANVARVEEGVQLAAKTCLVIRSCDFDAELCQRGALLLAQLLRFDTSARAAAFDAGAAQVMLSITETHRSVYDVVSTVLRMLLILGPNMPAFLDAARVSQSAGVVLQVVDECAAHIRDLEAHGASSLTSPTAGAAAGGGAAHAQSKPVATSSVRHLSELNMQEAHITLRQALAVLSSWCSADAEVAAATVSPAIPAIMRLLLPTSGIVYRDAVMVESVFALVVPLVRSSKDAAARFSDAGIMQAVQPVPQLSSHINRSVLVASTLYMLRALGEASPEVALTTLSQNGHGVAECLAVHWALKEGEDDASRRAIYAAAGSALDALFKNSEALRREQALAAARMGVEETIAAQAAKSRAAAIKALLLEDKAVERDEARLLKEAAHTALNMSRREDAPPVGPVTAQEVMEKRAGAIPLSLFPRDVMEALVTTEEVYVSVWFLPSMMAEGHKAKMRRMRINVSPDLETLTWCYESKHHHRTLEWSVRLADVLDVRYGVQRSGPKKRGIFSRSANASRGICLDSADGTQFHVEAANAEEQQLLMRTLSVLTQYARGRHGVHEPLPTVHISHAAALGDAPTSASA